MTTIIIHYQTEGFPPSCDTFTSSLPEAAWRSAEQYLDELYEDPSVYPESITVRLG